MRRRWITCWVVLGLIAGTGCKANGLKNLLGFDSDEQKVEEPSSAATDGLSPPDSEIARKARSAFDEWEPRRKFSLALTEAKNKSDSEKETNLEIACNIGLGCLSAEDRERAIELAQSTDGYDSAVLNVFRAQIEMFKKAPKEQINSWVDRAMDRKTDDSLQVLMRMSPDYKSRAEKAFDEGKRIQDAERTKRLAEIDKILGPERDFSKIDSVLQKNPDHAQDDLLYLARSMLTFSEYDVIDDHLSGMSNEEVEQNARGLELLMILADKQNLEAKADVSRRLMSSLSGKDTDNAYARFIAEKMPDKQSVIDAILNYSIQSGTLKVCQIPRELGINREIEMPRAYDAELKCLQAYYLKKSPGRILNRCVTIDVQLTSLGDVFSSATRSEPDGMAPSEDEYRRMKTLIQECYLSAFEQGYFYRTPMPFNGAEVDPDSFDMPMSIPTYLAFMDGGFDFLGSLYQVEYAVENTEENMEDGDEPKPSINFKYRYRDESRANTLLTNAAFLEDPMAQKYIAMHYLKDDNGNPVTTISDSNRERVEWGCYWLKRLELNRECELLCSDYALTKGIRKYCDMFCHIEALKKSEDVNFSICSSL